MRPFLKTATRTLFVGAILGTALVGANATTAFAATYEYSCAVLGVPLLATVDLTGTAPASVSPGADFAVSNVAMTITPLVDPKELPPDSTAENPVVNLNPGGSINYTAVASSWPWSFTGGSAMVPAPATPDTAVDIAPVNIRVVLNGLVSVLCTRTSPATAFATTRTTQGVASTTTSTVPGRATTTATAPPTTAVVAGVSQIAGAATPVSARPAFTG